MKKVVLGSAIALLISCNLLADDVVEKKDGDSFISKTYNFLGIQTKEETNKVLSSMANDIESLKKALHGISGALDMVQDEDLKNSTALSEIDVRVKVLQGEFDTSIKNIDSKLLDISSKPTVAQSDVDSKATKVEFDSLKNEVKATNEQISKISTQLATLTDTINALSKKLEELKDTQPAAN